MFFINPFFFYLLPLLAIPTIIHLLGKQRYQKIRFSSLRFLKELEHGVVRQLRIRQFILLILRTLLILFLILTFSRPFRSGFSASTFIGKGETLYLVVDNSSSMSAIVKGETLLQRGIKNLDVSISEIEFPIVLKIVEAVRPEEVAIEGQIHSISDFYSKLSTIRTEPLKGKIDRVLATILSDVEEHRESSFGVWIISDFQKSSWESKKVSANSILKLSQNEGCRIVLFPISYDDSNSAIYDIKISDQIIERGRPVEIIASIQNWGNKEKEIPTSLFFENERVGQTVVSVLPGKRRSVSFYFTPMSSGPSSGVIKIDKDNLTDDNKRYFVLNVPDVIHVLIVGRNIEDGRFLMTAINLENTSLIEAKFVPISLLQMEYFLEYDVMVFSNIDKLQPSLKKSLSTFLNSGKGCILFLGDDCDQETFNNFWAKEFGFPKWKSIRHSQSGDSFLKFGDLDVDHPLFKGLWRREDHTPSSPYFYTVPGFITGKNHLTVMTFSDGTPFIIESENANRKNFLVATATAKRWSSLHLTGFFPAIIQRMVQYLAGYSLQVDKYLTGDTIYLPTIKNGKARNLVIATPSRRHFSPSVENSREFKFMESNEQGIYDLLLDGNTVQCIAVNIHPGESEGEFLDREDFEEIVRSQPLQIAFLPIDEEIESARLQVGHEISSIFLLLALITAVLETYIGRANRTIKRKGIVNSG